MIEKGVVKLKINEQIFAVAPDIPPETTLNAYIRDYVHAKGTKYMCQEGGCGACIVAVKRTNQITQKSEIFAVNSCLVPVFSCYGWSIITVEGIGNQKNGFHKIQKALAQFSGTQCGYCSPGMVMNMFGLSNGGGKVTMEEVENAFGGNICRCTGYRPILDAFKSLASDATPELKQQCADIEDLMEELKICPKTKESCTSTCKDLDEKCSKKSEEIPDISLALTLSNGSRWFRVKSVKEVYEVYGFVDDDTTYMIVAGLTSHGVYRIKEPLDIYIDVNSVAELHDYKIDSSGRLVLGANMTLSSAMQVFRKIAAEKPYQFAHLKAMADHIDLVANVPIRNTGTIAGNLSIKYYNREFPSDILLMMEAVDAFLTIGHVSGIVNDYPLMAYLLDLDMRLKLITNVTIPPYDPSYQFRSYKIMKRAQNTHAYVNGAFLFKLNKGNKYLVTEQPNIVFGGINSNFIHAKNTESFLNGKQLLDVNNVKAACKILQSEIQPDSNPLEASAEFRRDLAVNLLYKCILSILGDAVSPQFQSGGILLQRPISKGSQDYQTNKSMYPVSKPIPKLEAFLQCSGEAEYVNDILASANELYGALVLSKTGPAEISSIDTSKIKNIEGFVTIITAKDIPGKNSFVELNKADDEVLLADKKIDFAGQPVAIVIAKTQKIANAAADKVVVNVKNPRKAVLDFVKVVDSGDQTRIFKDAEKPATKSKTDVVYKISGSLLIGPQYHYTMETQTCYCVPTEDGIDVYPSSQWIDLIQVNVAAVLAIPQNSVNVSVKRCGGGYGSKLGRSALVACACAVAANKLKVPVKMVMTMETNMECIGKRFPMYAKYEAGVDAKGIIQNIALKIYTNQGLKSNDPLGSGIMDFATPMYESDVWKYECFHVKTDVTPNAYCRAPDAKGVIQKVILNMYSERGFARNDPFLGIFIVNHVQSLYDGETWTIAHYDVKTDFTPFTFARAPGSTEAVALIEYIMEHIAYVTKQDPVSVRLANLSPLHDAIPPMVEDLKKNADFEDRKKQVEAFNKANRWKKRGLNMVMMCYPYAAAAPYHVLISVYAVDGTIAISHGGIEIGQGINTKVAQACAYTLGVDMNLIKIKASNTLTAPNNGPTGGSLASDGVTLATVECCNILLDRLKPVKEKNPGLLWKDLIKKANAAGVDLCVEYFFTPVKKPFAYNIYGATVTEVEIDLLTGQHQINRVDLLEDVGQSISPYVDIGQVEGAFIMGLGYWLNEKLVYEDQTGRLLTNRSWNYTPPGAKDIPVDFRVYFRRNAPNPTGVLRSKATGEPPLCMSCSAVFAMRNALASARKDATGQDDWFKLDLPYMPENVLLSSKTSIDQFNL